MLGNGIEEGSDEEVKIGIIGLGYLGIVVDKEEVGGA